MIRHFGGSIAFTAACLLAAGFLAPQGAVLSTLWIVAVLGVLEVSLSLDNAVVNAKVLKGMSPVWQRRFLTWGILIAVFGMRIVFPLAIVAIFAWVTPWDALMLAITDERRYADIMLAAHPQIAAFGGAFLLLVFLQFFVDAEKEHHWLPGERWLSGVGEWLAARPFGAEAIIVTLSVFAVLGAAQGLADPWSFTKAGLAGIAAWIAVHVLNTLIGSANGATVAKSGLGGFLYLEVLDASFSFDGVIGAFALSTNLFVIALGLGIGAMFVRSMTVYLVERGTLAEYRFLEHGAFWAIGSLAAIMLASVHFHIPEAITGLAGAALIGAGLLSSVAANRAATQS